MKLDQVLANQTEMLALMRKLTAASEAASEDVEDILPRPLQTAEELEESSRRLEEDGLLRKKTAECHQSKLYLKIHYFSVLGGHTVGDMVRRIMRRLGTNQLWSEYSVKGRKGKRPLNNLAYFQIIIKACIRANINTKATEVEDAMTETLRYAPHKNGGVKHKGQGKKTTVVMEEDMEDM